MKSAVALITAGIILLVVSLGTWAMTRPAPEAGDSATFEQALTASGQVTTPPTAPQLDPNVSGVPAAEVSQEIPSFTIGKQTDGQNKVPVGIRIPALGQQATIIPVGVEPNGDMEVPDNVTEVAWYKYGAAPGESGSAVLAAHVDLAGQGPGVFFGLRQLEPGSVIYVDFDDGSVETYRAEARTVYDKEELPTEAIFSREGPPVLTLVTCGGDFNQSIRRYDSNVVVYAVPVDTVPLEAS